MTNDYIESIHEKIETSRKELLDLGFRNPLLNYRLLRSRGLEIPDESSESLYRILVQEERSISFLPIKESDETDALSQPYDEDNTDSVSSRRTETRIQTDLTSNDLQKRLLSTYHLANTLLQEQGVNTLFLALGMVEWYEADSSDIPRYSPLVLVPVGLERSNIRDRFHLSYTGEALGANLSFIEKVQTDFGTSIPQIPDDEDFDLSSYFEEVVTVINDFPRWSVHHDRIALGFFSFSKFLMYRDLDPVNWPATSAISDNKLIQALFENGFSEPDPLIDTDDHLDDHLEPEQIHHVVDADSSQALVIIDVNSGRNLVVEGPPGTGKSQTITNVIGEALGKGKTVLFVSEKMAALEVVKRRLDSVGLGDACLELHSHKTTKKAVLNELSSTLELKQPMLEGIEDDFEALTRLRNRLNAYSQAVNTPVANTEVSPYRAYGELIQIRENTQNVNLPRLVLNEAETWSPNDYRTTREVVQELQARLANTGVPVNHAFWGCRVGVMMPSDYDRFEANNVDAIDKFKKLQSTILNLSQELHLGVPGDVQEIAKLNKSADRVVSAPNLRGVDFKSEIWLERPEDLVDLLNAGARLSNLHDLYDEVLTANAWDSDMSELRQALVTKGRKFWRVLSGDYRRAKAQLAGLCRSSMPPNTDTQLELVDTIITSQQLRKTVVRYSDLGRELFGSLWREEKSDWETLSTTSSWVTALLGEIGEGDIYPEIIKALESDEGRGIPDGLIKDVNDARESYETSLVEVLTAVDLDAEKRFGNSLGFIEQPLSAQVEILLSWQDTSGLQDIVRFNIAAGVCTAEGLAPVISIAESWPDAATHLLDLFGQTWFESILGQAMKERQALSNFDGASHEQAIEQFQELDRLALEHNRARLAHAHWSKLPRHESGGQLGVLRRQFQLKKRHLPIRQLMIQAGNAIQAIKPVFMMSPLSIARYAAPGSLHFDLVVFDEASQVRPVDALGAILRGSQAVVVGDSKQLPPTNFFNSVTQNDDDSVTSDLESILGLFLAQNAPSRMLRWHYRSRHESLIAVSNQEFYGGDLVVFPSPDAEKSEVGLIYHHLGDTVYERGNSASNPKEAQIVAEAVMKHAHASPALSLGVSAFSTAQMTAILDRVEILRRKDPSAESFFSSHPEEPFFVKNLENVQGDERDVMFISIGYGRDATGRLDMNFGPLNNDGGERRLNVLITRAKSRCEVFTNLSADDIDLGRSRAQGVYALKAFLSFAERGELSEMQTESGRLVDSPFQEAVAARLNGLGYDVRQEIGTGGYFVDLAIVDPSRPGRYLIGIECDGATYHSARSARDRDRLRWTPKTGQVVKLQSGS